MAQSYDVYFARMLLTLGIVDRARLQECLAEFQRIPGAKGFPRYLVEKGLIDVETGRRVAADLERYLLERRARAPRVDEAPHPAQQPQSMGLIGDSAETERPNWNAPPPPERTARTPATAQPRSVVPTEMKRKSSAVQKALPATEPEPIPQRRVPAPPQPSAPLPPPPPPLPSGVPTARRDSARMPKADMQKIKKTSDLPIDPAATPSRSSARVAKPEVKVPPSGKDELEPPPSMREGGKPGELPPARESARFKKPTEMAMKVPAPPSAPPPPPPMAPPPATAPAPGGAPNKQWELLQRATKDPLAKLVGRRVGQTEITRLLETTPNVTVFEGKFGDDERPALIKVLRPEKVKNKEAFERFTREAKALEKIDHPNIARVLETGEAEKARYLTIEQSTGEPLSSLLERSGKLPVERVQKIARAIALALTSAHKAGIVHRDIRPANIFLEEDQTVKIAGFGVARDVEVPGRLTATGQITGHPSYVAPETALGVDISGKADMYSLGILMFLALTGRLPFESRSVVKLVGMQLNTPPPPILTLAPGLPPKLAALVDRLMIKAPDKRPDATETAKLLGERDLLDGGADQLAAEAAAAAAKAEREAESDEDLLRRMLAPDEHLSAEEPLPAPIGGPSCAACELPLGNEPFELHGNSICSKCMERVEALDLCAACFHEITEKERGASDAAVFAGHVYCPGCTARVQLPCAQCHRPIPLSDLGKGKARAKGDQLVHATGCS